MFSMYEQTCSVDGTLMYVLWVSRAFGLAPLTFEKWRKGWYIRTSTAYDLYGKVLVIIACILGFVALLADIYLEPETSLRTKTYSNRLVWIIDVTTINIVAMVSTFTAMDRMKYFITYSVKLEEIESSMRPYHRMPQRETKIIIFIILSMIATISLIVVDFGSFIIEVIRLNGKVFTSTLYIFYNFTSVMQQVMIVQFAVIAIRVLSNFQNLNQSLKVLLQKILKLPFHHELIININCFMRVPNKIFKKPTNSIVDIFPNVTKYQGSIPSALHHLALMYSSMCDMVTQVDDSYSVVLAALFVSFLIHLISTPYHLITNIFRYDKTDYSDPDLQFEWAIFHLSNMASVIEPCHRTHEQMESTKIILSRMFRIVPLEYGALVAELEFFYKHLKLNNVMYSPMNMFTLNRSLVIAILGSVTTYLVVIIQL